MIDEDRFVFEGDGPRPVSVYRAFVYSAGLPGAGEWYAGRRLRGALTCAAALCLMIAFAAYSVGAVREVVHHAGEGLRAGRMTLGRATPFLAAGACLFGFYLVWLLSMAAAVEAARGVRRDRGLALQRSAAWGAVMSWFCPGSGQVFTGQPFYGYAILTAFVAAGLFVAVSYKHLADTILDMLGQGQLERMGRMEALRYVQDLLIILDHGFAQWLRRAVTGLAVAETSLALSRSWIKAGAAPGPDPPPWPRTPIARAAGLLVLGWLCPGAGQILQGRPLTGWIFFGTWFGVQALLGLILWAGGPHPSVNQALSWLGTLILLAAMIEAPVRLFKHKAPSGPDSS